MIRVPLKRKSVFGAAGIIALMAHSAVAQQNVDQMTAEAVTEGDLARYSLVAVEGDILRVDRVKGTVSICEEKGQAWRCSPVPLAEEAYQSEINDLVEEVDRLAARVQELEQGASGSPKPLQPDVVPDAPRNELEGSDQTSGLDKKDEEDLEKVMNFTESAMRRFFGMVRELQSDFEGGDKN